MKELFVGEYKKMMESDPSFKDFVEHNKGKSIEEICEDFDIDIDALKNLILGQKL